MGKWWAATSACLQVDFEAGTERSGDSLEHVEGGVVVRVLQTCDGKGSAAMDFDLASWIEAP